MRWFSKALIAAVAAAQLYIAYRYFGFFTGDEVEVLAEAFHRATNYPYTPWDVRNLFVPDVVVAPVVWLATKLGLDAIVLASLPFILLTAITIELVRRLALKWSDGDERAATLAMLFFALHWIPLGFGATTYPRTLAAACLTAAALRGTSFGAGALAGLAITDRFSEIVFLLPLASARRRPAGRLAAGSAAVLLITLGLYDYLTYGTPFSTIIKFAHVTLVAPDFASRVKYQSPIWYFANILRWLAPTILPLLWIARRRVNWLFIVVPLVALSIVRHKELRYLQTTIPFIAVAAGIGASMLWQQRRALAAALVAISLAWNLAGIRFVQKKTMPAVLAARALAADPNVHRVAVSQLWAYGDRLYFTTRIEPPVDLEQPPRALPNDVDAICLWATDLDAVTIPAGYVKWRTFRDGPAKPAVVFRRPAAAVTSASGISDRARR